MPNIVETARKNDDLSTLVKAIEAADLGGTLSGKGPYTVFAPNDTAFENLPPGRLDDLLDNKQELSRILKFHVVEGKMKQSDLLGKGRVQTLQGGRVQIEKDGGVHIGKSKVVQNDIQCDNGICHVIDTVLMP